MASTYKVGTISAILAKEAGGGGRSGEKQDVKLAALFGGAAGVTSSKVFRTVKVNESVIFKNRDASESMTSASGKGKVKKEAIKLGNRDAAGVRVEAKRKIKIEQVEVDSSTLKKKERKKVGAKQITVQDETISSSTSSASAKTSVAKLEKKGKKKNKKRLKKGVLTTEKEDDKRPESESEKLKVNKLKNKKKGKVVKEKVKEAVEQEIDGEDDAREDDGSQEENGRAVEHGKGTDYFKTLAERNAPKAKDPELEARTIFVGNIPGDTKKKQLKKLFLRFGSVETVRLRCGAPSKPTQLKKVAINKKELHSDKSTLAGYVRFKTRGDAEKAAAEAKGLMINENHLVVDLVVKLKTDKRDNKKAIFVGNLNLKLTDEELWRFFEDCGKINTVRIIRDNQTGLGKGFGYVNFDEREAVALALQKNELELKSREIRISRHIKKMKVKKGDAAVLQKYNNRNHHQNDVQMQRTGLDKSQVTAAGASRSGDKMKGLGRPVRKPDSRNKFVEKEKRKGNATESGRREEITVEYSGDRLAEIGKLKRKSNKPNKGELRKAKIAKLLTGKAPHAVVVSNSHAPNTRQASLNPNATNRKRYFN